MKLLVKQLSNLFKHHEKNVLASFSLRCFANFDPKARKRFYKQVSISQDNGMFEINLDGRKVKTPLGNVLQTHHKALALAIANEWQAQKDLIRMSFMHLTTLANTAIDNPLNLTCESLVESILAFLESDTICFRNQEPPDLMRLELEKWQPIVEWFMHRFECQIPVTDSVIVSPISQHTKHTIDRHLNSHNFPSLLAIQFATENLKSLILTLASTERRLSVEEAVSLSRLEVDFQTSKWGNVEWSHDLDHESTKARVSAAMLFYFFNCESYEARDKLKTKLDKVKK